MEVIWITKLFLSHLITDFLLQRKSWIADRKIRHFSSRYLYLHTFITATTALVFIGWEYWFVALIILVTHTAIDGWKSYQKEEARYFIIDQVLHLLVIAACWWFTFYDLSDLRLNHEIIASDSRLWITLTAFVFVAWPSAFLIGQLTKTWRQNLDNSDALANAGKWIGIIERVLILILVLHNHFEAIGLLIAGKGLIRFNETNRPEQKTEYLLIGTLISIVLALVTGLVALQLTS